MRKIESYIFSSSGQPADRKGPLRTAITLIGWGTAAFALTLIAAFSIRYMKSIPYRESGAEASVEEDASPSAFLNLVYPTTASLLSDNLQVNQDIFMLTASGKPESGDFGSVRTGRDGLARFHAGIDIAPLERDRRGNPRDVIKSIAQGEVAHVNRQGGNSSYGIYVILLHDDPLGKVYSLYAHMASVRDNIKAGTKVEPGTELGIMGHTANTGIPRVRAHLHLEVGVLLNSKFGQWARNRKIIPDRGNYHGWNLFSVNPLEVYKAQKGNSAFSMLNFLRNHPVAFEMVLHSARPLNYFERYPSLWKGSGKATGTVVLSVSEGGVILSGRPAGEEEKNAMSSLVTPLVQNVNETVLGRNGLHLIERSGSDWKLGRAAARWLEILLY